MFDNRKEEKRFYSSKRWRLFRAVFRLENPFCVQCKSSGNLVPMELVDHIIPIQEGGSEFEVSNCQSLCHSCHNVKRAKEKARKETTEKYNLANKGYTRIVD